MQTKIKEIIMAIALAIIIPSFLVTMVVEKTEKPELNESLQFSASAQTTLYSEDYLKVLMTDGSVDEMAMSDYLTCVLLCEMPVTFEEEALKAQAIVARTYALRKHESGGKHTNAAVCTDSSCCQGFRLPEEHVQRGGTSEEIEKIKGVVVATSGLVLTFNGELIDATYFSCSGGMTEDAVAVWGSDIPYLQSTESPGEETAQHYIDTVSFSVDEFTEMLKLDYETAVSVSKITYTQGGGVDTITINGEVFYGTQVRQLLGLRSTAFVINSLGDHVVITTKGFGHRVGMSQYGAEAMAVQGKSYEEILTHYYHGVKIETR